MKIYRNINPSIILLICYRKIAEENKHDSNKCWSILKQVIRIHINKSSFFKEFLINNIRVSDKKAIVERFNTFFANIGTRTSHNVPPSNKCFSSFITQPLRYSIFIRYVALQNIIDIVNKMKPKSSSGKDEISTKLMKTTITHINNPITRIINQSLQTGIVLEKIAKVLPIFKSSNQTLLKKYRPISLLSTLSKVLDRAMYNQLMLFLNAYNILSHYSST